MRSLGSALKQMRKKIREKATKEKEKSRFYFMLIDICSSKVDIYHGTLASNCFKRHKNS